jgi:hypothetical protein
MKDPQCNHESDALTVSTLGDWDISDDTMETKEQSFFDNPTLLSRMIVHHKFVAAARRIWTHKNEVSIWICAERGEGRLTAGNPSLRNNTQPTDTRLTKTTITFNPVYAFIPGLTTPEINNDKPKDQPHSFRQLPLHTACSQLAHFPRYDTSKANDRMTLEKLIVGLVFAYPKAAEVSDHDGHFPLHTCIACQCAPDTVSMLLVAAPDVVYKYDAAQLLPRDLLINQNVFQCSYTEAVGKLLLRSVDFWTLARQEAELRLKHRSVSFPDAGSDQEESEVNITSMSVLASTTVTSGHVFFDDEESSYDNETVVTTSTKALKPHSWTQLERRVIDLEHALTDSYENVFELEQRVKYLTKENEVHLTKLERLTGSSSTTGRAVTAVERNENMHLQERIRQLEAELEAKACGTIKPKEIVLPALTHAKIASEEELRDLQIQVEYLTKKNLGYRQKLAASDQQHQSSGFSMKSRTHRHGRLPLSSDSELCATGQSTILSHEMETAWNYVRGNPVDDTDCTTSSFVQVLTATVRKYGLQIRLVDDYDFSSGKESLLNTSNNKCLMDEIFAEAAALYYSEGQN